MQSGASGEGDLDLIRSYAGWGGAADAFRDDAWLADHPAWREVNRRIRAAMTDEEYAHAEESVLTAYYTPAGVVGAVWDALANHGLGAGDAVLDPSCGTGNFMVAAPAGTRLWGIDIDSTSAAMASALLPHASVHAAAYEGCRVPPGSFDAVVTNAPFSNDIKVDRRDKSLSIHNYFLLRALDDVRPGGVVAMVCSRWVMDALDASIRTEAARHAELLAAVRLPQETFGRQAGTDAIADVLVLRRRAEPLSGSDEQVADACPWVRTGTAYELADGRGPIRANSAFLDGGQGDIVGKMGWRSGPYGPRLSVAADGREVGAGLSAALRAQLDRTIGRDTDLHDGMMERGSEPSVATVPKALSLGEYLVADDGSVWLLEGDTCRELEVAGDELARLAAMIGVRDAYIAAREAQLDRDATDGQVQEAIASLRTTYEKCVLAYGRLCERRNADLYRRETTGWALRLLGLEETDGHGSFVSTTPALERRILWPEPQRPAHVNTPQEALAISLDATGGVDEAMISELLGIHEDEVEAALGPLVVRDPISGMLADSTLYLSGDVGSRLDAVTRMADEAENGPLRDAEAAWLDEVGLAGHVAAMLATEEFLEAMAELDRAPSESRGGSVCWHTICDPYDTEAAALPWREWVRAVGYGTGRYGPYGGLATPLLAAWATALPEGSLDGSFVRDGDGTLRPRAARIEDRLDLPLACAVASYAREGSLVTGSPADREPGTHHPTAVNLWLLARSRGVGEEALEWVLQRCSSQDARHGDGAAHEVPIADAVARLLDMPDEGTLGDVARAMKEHPEAIEYLALRSIEWEQMPDSEKGPLLRNWGQRVDQRRSYSPRDGRSVTWWVMGDALRSDGGLDARWATREGFAEYARQRATRIEAARASVDRDALEAARHVQRRLEAALPPELSPDEIATSPSSPWVRPSDVLEFVRDEMLAGIASSSAGRFVVARVNDAWTCETAGVKVSPEAQARWGIVGTPTPTHPDGEAKSPLWLLQRMLAGTGMEVMMDHPEGETDDKGRVIRVKDVKATLAAWEARERLEARFAEWLHADPAREARVCARYNRDLNHLVPTRYDGSYLTLPGKSADVELRPWQKDAVSCVLRSGHGTLLAHVVGAGKTMACVAAMHEAKRLGRCSKPMAAVPNHLVGNWASEWQRLYPDDRLLVMDDRSVATPDAERRFWGAVANGDWDGVIIRQSGLDMIHLSAEAMDGLVAARMDEFRTASGGDYRSVKRQKAAEARIRRQVERVCRLTASEVAHDERVPITLDQTGIDFVCVDESHAYKNLRPATAMDVAGITAQSSRKAERMLQLCQWMQGRGLGGNVLFATGTPVTNSMAELYTQFRYLHPDVLRSQGMRSFDDWAAAHGRVVAAAEPKVEGGFQVKERFSKFVNVPELMCAAHTMMDLVTREDINLALPQVEEVQVVVPMAEAQRTGMEWLAQRGEVIRAGGVDPSVDNMLAITSDGQKLSLDPKLLFADDADVPDLADAGKVGACAKNVARLHEQYGGERGCQAVFCDSSTDAGKGKWNALDALREQLVSLGVPRNEIASVNDVGSDPDRRQALFERVRSGEVRVLLGSTATAGTGANIQDRLVAIHHLDYPWTSASLEQRRGRIERQGNRFGSAYEYRYVTRGSFDAFMLDALTRKASFVSQIMRNEVPTREVDDLSQVVLGYEELRLLATGDPAVQQRLTLQNHVDQLVFAKSSFEAQQRDLRHRAETLHQPEVSRLEPLVQAMQADSGSMRAASEASRHEGSNWPGMTVRNTVFKDRKSASEALNQAALAVGDGDGEVVGTYVGTEVMLRAERVATDLVGGTATIRRLGLRSESGICYWSPNPIGTGAVAQVDHVLRDVFAKQLARAEGELEQHRRAIGAIAEATARKWDGEAELAEARAALAKLPPATEEPRQQARKVSRDDVRQAAIGNTVEVRTSVPEETVQARPSLSGAVRESAAACTGLNAQGARARSGERVA